MKQAFRLLWSQVRYGKEEGVTLGIRSEQPSASAKKKNLNLLTAPYERGLLQGAETCSLAAYSKVAKVGFQLRTAFGAPRTRGLATAFGFRGSELTGSTLPAAPKSLAVIVQLPDRAELFRR